MRQAGTYHQSGMAERPARPKARGPHGMKPRRYAPSVALVSWGDWPSSLSWLPHFTPTCER